MEAPDLKKAIKERNWEEGSRILKDYPELAKKELSWKEFDVLWEDAPLETIQALLEAWPEAYEEPGDYDNLVTVKSRKKQWDFLKSILHTYRNIVTAKNVYSACTYNAPLGVLKLMLDQQPNAPLEESRIIFELIEKNKLEHFLAVLDQHPTITEVMAYSTRLTPLLYIFQNKKTINADWIVPILKANPDSAKQKDFSGKTPLHLAYQQGASSELVDIIQQAYPEAENIRDNLGCLPKDIGQKPDLKKAIEEADWGKTSRIVKDHPESAKKALSEDEFNILWWYAPLETIQALLTAWPEAYKERGWGSDLVKTKLYAEQWDFLNKIFQEFPHVLETKYVCTAAMNGAPLEFLTKHWKETGIFFYSVHNKDWGKFGERLNDNLQLIKRELSEDEFQILWKDAPLETIRALLQAWPEAYKKRGYGDDLVEARCFKKQWDFLNNLFQEFPQVLETEYANTAAENGASLEFLMKHWKERRVLLYSVHNKDWGKTSRILKHHPELSKEALSKHEFTILWEGGPLETIQSLLRAWPEAYEMEDYQSRNLVAVKLYSHEWDFLKSVLPSCPNVVTAGNVKYACKEDASADVLKLMLDQQPNAPLERPNIIFRLIEKNKLGHFLAVLGRCPAATEVKQHNTHLTPLLIMFQEKQKINADWIGLILKANPNAAKQKDSDGKTALHLAHQHGASSDLIDMIQQSYPEAENERDNLGRLPKDLSNQLEKTVFTTPHETLIFRDNSNIKKSHSYPENAVVVCRGDMLIRDPQGPENKEERMTFENYSKQVAARHGIFETLLEEFSKMVGVDDKDVIQKAAAIQALLAHYLSDKNDAIINFGSYKNPGYWFQQEILKLVMRVYHETQCELDDYDPSVAYDAHFCMNNLERKKNGHPSPKPRDRHVKAYNELTQWLTEGLDKSSYTLQGPVLKPLQSLFNKLFIRRGQTSVHVIGDMVRGTLLLGNMAMLNEVVKQIENTFSNITEDKFRHPDSCNGLADFLTYVHDDLKYLPDSDDVLPYRFKANSSQKNKDKPLWYNLNFFFQIPEYHCVGFSEMFVACELQIGVEEEINKHRKVHDAYERDRILSNQPLLKNYDAMINEEGEDRRSQLSSCTEDDNKLIEKVLFGKIATEVLIPCATEGNDDKKNILLFDSGPFSLTWDEVRYGSFAKPERFCLNNRSLNWYALDCPKENDYDGLYAACVVAGPYKLDQTKRYFVESFVLKNIHSERFEAGLYAHVGPYLIQIACSEVTYETDDFVVVKSGRNFSYLEQACPVPAGTTALEVILYGNFSRFGAAEFKCDEVNLLLKVFDIE